MSLINPNQCWAFGVMICDDPTYNFKYLGMDTYEIFVPFLMKGTKCGKMTQDTTGVELEHAPRIYLLDKN